MARKILISTPLWIGAACIILTGHTWWAVQVGAGHPIPRGGALIILCGLAVIARPIVRLGIAEFVQRLSSFDGGNITPTSEEIEDGREKHQDALAVQFAGPLLVGSGTLLAGYGDLIARWLLRLPA
ncbi:MAG: hypothetical protein IT557_13370 [Alphaproteobacteria bacterium]|nr:hypothetical protein [Alphaproteobacteria bacterium]